MKRISWKKEGNVYVAQFFHNGISIAAEISPDRTTKAIAGQIGTANHDSFGATLRLPDGRWFHPAVYRVDRARVHIDSGMNKDRALANAWMEEREAAERFLEAEKGTPHLRLLVVKARRGTVMERKEIGGLDMPIPLFGGPCNAYSELANEMAADTATKVIKAIRDLVDHQAA
jgi:hypothetical protein